MAKLGLSNEVIVVKIEVSDCAFDTTPGALRQLKTAGVPDAVLIEMIRRSH